MNQYSSLFKKGMSSKQMGLKYFKICDSFKGDERKLLDEAFKEAFLQAQHKETEYAFAKSGDGYAYCAN